MYAGNLNYPDQGMSRRNGESNFDDNHSPESRFLTLLVRDSILGHLPQK